MSPPLDYKKMNKYIFTLYCISPNFVIERPGSRSGILDPDPLWDFGLDPDP